MHFIVLLQCCNQYDEGRAAPTRILLISSSLTFPLLSGDVDLLKEECRMLREECQALKEDNKRLSERLQLLQRQRTW